MRHQTKRYGFTVTELLVVVAIIAVMIGLLLPALGAVKAGGRKVNEMSAARQLMLAYAGYAHDNYEAVLPGYRAGLRAEDQHGRAIADVHSPVAAARYPWRIAPYLDYSFRTLYQNGHEHVLERFEQGDWAEGDADLYYYFVSLAPSLGLNTWWVGGDEAKQAFAAFQPYGRYFVVGTSEVRRTDQLIVFASARGVDPLGQTGNEQVVEGYFQITSPIFNTSGGSLWSDVYDEGELPSKFGYVSPRYRGSAVTAMFDGHVTMLEQAELQDMRHWANRADGPEYGLAPPSTNP